MGFLDSISGQVLGSLSSAGDERHSGLMGALEGLVNNQQTGGLSGLVAAFEQKGLGGLIGSWVGTGQNLPISAEQLQSVLGSEQVQVVAQKLGFTPQELSSHLTELMPQVIDKLTPAGALPESGTFGSLLGMFKSAAR